MLVHWIVSLTFSASACDKDGEGEGIAVAVAAGAGLAEGLGDTEALSSPFFHPFLSESEALFSSCFSGFLFPVSGICPAAGDGVRRLVIFFVSAWFGSADTAVSVTDGSCSGCTPDSCAAGCVIRASPTAFFVSRAGNCRVPCQISTPASIKSAARHNTIAFLFCFMICPHLSFYHFTKYTGKIQGFLVDKNICHCYNETRSTVKWIHI
jgi:hypothetical protein